MVVPDATVTVVALSVPKPPNPLVGTSVTVDPVTKPVPKMVIVVPPLCVPVAGVTDETVGTSPESVMTYLVEYELVPPVVDTVTKYVPDAVTAGDTTVMLVALTTSRSLPVAVTAGETGVPPVSSVSVTTAPVVNPVPVIVSEDPPAVVPVVVEVADTVGTVG
jgi:hypothetical protein